MTSYLVGRAISVCFALALCSCSKAPDIEPLEDAVIDRTSSLAPSLAGTSFGKAISAAVAQSPTVGRSRALLREQEANLLATGGFGFPQVSLGIAPSAGSGVGVSAVVSVTQLIFDAGAGRAIERAAEARVLGGVAGGIEARSQAAFNAVSIWADVVAARSLRDLTDSSLESLMETEQRIETRTLSGAGSSSDLLVAQSRLANERALAIEAKSAVTQAEATFVAVFGYEPPGGMSLPPSAPSISASSIESAPVVLQAKADLLSAQAELVAAGASKIPSISLQATATDSGAMNVGPTAEREITGGRQYRARAEAALARFEAKQVELDAIQRELTSHVGMLRAEELASAERVSAAAEAVAATNANLVAAKDQFEIGRSSLIELLDAEREAVASKRMLISAERDRIVTGYAILTTTSDILAIFAIEASNDLADLE